MIFIENVFIDVKKMKFIPIKIMLTFKACEADIAMEAALSSGVQTRLTIAIVGICYDGI